MTERGESVFPGIVQEARYYTGAKFKNGLGTNVAIKVAMDISNGRVVSIMVALFFWI